MAVSAKYDEFNHWWATEGDWVEEPNYRRNGMSGVQCVERNGKKLYVKRMTHHLFHSVRYPFGRPTIVREWRALLVTEDMAGFISIADWYAQHAVSPYSDEVRQAMLKAVALAFKKMHSINRQHGCCYVRHIYVKTEGKAEAGFLDLEKSRRRLRRDKAPCNRCRPDKTHKRCIWHYNQFTSRFQYRLLPGNNRAKFPPAE